MQDNVQLWAGNIFGTNTGNVFLDVRGSDDQLNGILRISDDKFGVVVYEVSGSFNGSKLSLSGNATQEIEGMQFGDIQATGNVATAGEIKGEWSSKIGTGGTFIIFPHAHNEALSNTANLPPERIHSAYRSLGALRLYPDDLQKLVSLMAEDIARGRVTITYQERGNDVIQYASDFDFGLSKYSQINNVKLYIQEPDLYDTKRFVSVELVSNGRNAINVQGIQETWVIGKIETIFSYLKTKESILSTQFGKYGLNINIVLAVGIIATLPELKLLNRIIFLFVGLGLASLIAGMHKRYIPTFVLYGAANKPSILSRSMPQFVSWMIAATSGLVATFIYGWLKKEIHLSDLIFW